MGEETASPPAKKTRARRPELDPKEGLRQAPGVNEAPSTNAAPGLERGEMLRLAVPSAVFAILTNAYRVVDQYWVDAISVSAQAAVGATMFVLVVAYASFELVSAGAGPLVARATGAQEPLERRFVFGSALFGALVLAAIWTTAGASAAEPIAASLGLEDDARREAARYLGAIAVTCLPLVLTPLMDASYLAMGDARTPLALHAVALAANLGLTPLFVIGLEGGVVGAALASTLSRAIATTWGLGVLVRRLDVRFEDVRPGVHLRRVLRVGAPMAWNTALYGGAYWIMLRVAVSPLGPEVNAALGIGWSALEGLSWPLFHGLALAAASIVGRQIGAGRPDAARATALGALVPTGALGVVVGSIFIFAGSAITAPFASDPQVHAQATLYASIVGFSQIGVALEATAEGVLAGAGATRAVFWSSAPLNLLRAPLAWFFAVELGFGPAALWWVIAATTYAKTLIKVGLVLRGRWSSVSI